MDMKLAVIVLSVSDDERAKRFYGGLGRRLDANIDWGDGSRLVDRGVEVSELFHRAGREGRTSGPDPERGSYASFASFSDPDGNGWLLQEITAGLPGRVDAGDTTFTSSTELAAALRRAAAAHGEHEKRTDQHDEGWPDGYAEYIVPEQADQELPT